MSRKSYTTDTHKWCNRCRLWLPHSAFYKVADKSRPYGLSGYCRDCCRGSQSPVLQRASAFKRRYGITLAGYNALLEKQGGVCAICHQPQRETHKNGKAYMLAVDHDHSTGKVRGLLCNKCNQALGALSDSVTLLQRAIDYLTQHH
jgi:hypothetical protein